MRVNKIFPTIGVALLLSISGSPAMAETTSNVVLNLEGNPTCSSLGDNELIREIRDNDPQVGIDNVVSGIRIDGQAQFIEYTIDDSGSLPRVSWEIVNPDMGVNPVNFVILKSRGNAGARVFHFGGEGAGAIADNDEEARGDLTAVSFCYGLTEGPVGQELAEIPDCQTLDDDNGLGGTLIARCPEIGGSPDPNEPRLLISLDLLEDNFDVQACTCNLFDENNEPTGLPTCDPDLAVGQAGACIQTSTTDPMQGVNERPPVDIQAVETPNSYICFTVGGTRTCYGEF